MEVVVLGTGTPMPDSQRAGTGVAFLKNESSILVDCGRGITQRALQAGLDLTRLEAVFITHNHSDHVSDLATLATTRWTAGGHDPLPVVAPRGPSSRFAQHCLDPFEDSAFHSQAGPAAGPRPRIDVRPFAATDQVCVVFEEAGWTVSSVLVDHQPIENAVGYRIERAGKRVVVSGDTAVGGGIRRLAAAADLLIHQAALTAAVSTPLLAWNASARSIGELAAEVDVASVLLTHLLPGPRTTSEEAAFIAEARKSRYAGPVNLAHDLQRLELGRQSPPWSRQPIEKP